MRFRSTLALAGPLILAALSACSSGPPSAGKGGASGATGGGGGASGATGSGGTGGGGASDATGSGGTGGGASDATGSGGTGGDGASDATGGGSDGAAKDGGNGGDAKDGGSSGMCALDPVGLYVFHVHNGTAAPRYWFTYCGKALPIALDTPAGRLPASPGTIGDCGFTCDKLYADPTYPPFGCTDCGGGTWVSVQPGQTVDIAWDRRVYSAHTLEAPCSPWSGQTCAMGKTVARSTAQTGTIHVCDSYVIVSCNGPHDVPFTVDTTTDAGTIELAP